MCLERSDPLAKNTSVIPAWLSTLQTLVQVLTQEDISEVDIQKALVLILRLTKAETASIDAFLPLSLPAISVPAGGTQPSDHPSYSLSTSLASERGTPCRLSVKRTSEDFDDLDRAAFQTAAIQVGYFLRTAARVQEERSERLLAESLRRFAEQLSSTLDLEEILALILDQVASLIPYDSANVLLLEDGILQMHANRGYQQLADTGNLPGVCFVPERTVGSREVLANKDIFIITDTTHLNDWLWLPCGKHVRSWMGVPLLIDGQPIGLIQIDKAVPNFFTHQHGELAMAMAVPAALAIDKARMLAQIRDAQEQLRGLSVQVMQAQEQERGKLAVELHDHAGQALLGLRGELQVLKHRIPPDCTSAFEQIDTLNCIMMELSRDLRRLALDLHPPLLSDLGLTAALEQYLDEFKRRIQILIEFEIHPAHGLGRLPEAVELVCYRVVQEALTNLARHAQARSVKIVFIQTEDHLSFSIQDDGVGLPRRQARQAKIRGFGLLGMRERVLSVGGELQIWSQAGRGTRIDVDIPLPSMV